MFVSPINQKPQIKLTTCTYNEPRTKPLLTNKTTLAATKIKGRFLEAKSKQRERENQSNKEVTENRK